MVILFGTLVVLLVIGFSVAFALIGESLAFILIDSPLPMVMVIRRSIRGIDSFTLLAVPFFILAGNLMNHADITNRIFDFAVGLTAASSTIGPLIPPSLPLVAVLIRVTYVPPVSMWLLSLIYR